MALVKGTNCGFVTVAPTDDPAGTNIPVDNFAFALKDTAPATVRRVTEIGWYCDNTTEESNFEVGIYDHNVGDDNPEAVVGSLYQINAKGTTSGWKRVTVDIDIEPNTIYWIAVQLDNTITTTNSNYSLLEGEKFDLIDGVTVLPNPWGVSDASLDSLSAVYALWEAAPSTNTKINISDAWKDVDSMKINIGDVWKDVTEVKQNIGDAWKTVF